MDDENPNVFDLKTIVPLERLFCTHLKPFVTDTCNHDRRTVAPGRGPQTRPENSDEWAKR